MSDTGNNQGIRQKKQTRPGGGHGPMGRGGPGAMMPGEKARDFKKTIIRLVSYLKPYRFRFVFVLIFAIISTVFNIAGPKILGQATTNLFEGVLSMLNGSGGINFDTIGSILLTVLLLYIISSFFSYLMGYLMAFVSSDISYRFRKEISQKINKIPLSYYDKTQQGEVLSRITNDVDTINQTLSQSLTQIITSVVTVLGVLVMMLTISWQMTLTALLVIPLSGIIVTLIVKQSQKYFKKQQDYLGHVNGHVEEMYGGHIIMKAFNGEKESIEKFGDYNDTLYESAWKSQFLSGIMMPMMTFIGNLGYVVVTILGGWLAVRSLVTVGDIQAFLQYIRNFTQPLMQIANISNILQQTAAAAERVFAFLDEDQELAETKNPVKDIEMKGHVSFENVAFSYKKDVPVIKNFSAIAEPGQKIAIVGPTGAGKTTMVKLLMRFYDINSGRILVNGEEITRYTRADLRKRFAMVLQDTWLFNGTIRDNIRYGNPDASDEQVTDAAKAAHADHFIHTLPGAYDRVLNEESSNISQGQRQLLTIARAILADPEILILDEATSSVDTRTEELIQKAMDRLMGGRTSFIIAHRLSTIKNADLILVMKDGDIIEQGTHGELLDKKGFYSELYHSQFDHPA